MENDKTKKAQKKYKIINLKRSQKEWDKIINEAKNKESTWKYLREYFGDEVIDREDETI